MEPTVIASATDPSFDQIEHRGKPAIDWEVVAVARLVDGGQRTGTYSDRIRSLCRPLPYQPIPNYLRGHRPLSKLLPTVAVRAVNGLDERQSTSG